MALEKEIETYKAKLSHLLTDEGKFVLIQGEEVIGIFGTYEDALKEGYDKFDLSPFLVRKIQAVEQVQYITRPVTFACPT